MFDKSQTLYDSNGRSIATARDDTLFAPDGTIVGLYLRNLRIFVDFSGDYLGELVYGNRLVARIRPLHARVAACSRPLPRGTSGMANVVAINHCKVPLMHGLADVAIERLSGRRPAAA